jgi:hypothetical protein
MEGEIAATAWAYAMAPQKQRGERRTMTWTKLAVIVVTQLLCTIVIVDAIWTFRDLTIKELVQIDRDLPR